jgi:hypothetical protein
MYKLLPGSKVSQAILGSAGITALGLFLRHIILKEAKYISDLSSVGGLATEKAEEYDIIIVGGGDLDSYVLCNLTTDPNSKRLQELRDAHWRRD